jgi:hypothetical protein
MAVLGHLICRTCKERTCLGKWLRHVDNKGSVASIGFGFWRGGTTYEGLGMKTLNFLARHTNHDILILSDGEYDKLSFTEPLVEYRNVEVELMADWPKNAELPPSTPSPK